MKIKQKIITDRKQNDQKIKQIESSQSLLNRLQKQYLLNKENSQNLYNNNRQNYPQNNYDYQINKVKNKNIQSKINNNQIHIYDENYPYNGQKMGKKILNKVQFKQKKYQQFIGMEIHQDQQQILDDPYYQSSKQISHYQMSRAQSKQNFVKRQTKHHRYQSMNFGDNDRPLTFGIVQNCSMISSQNWIPTYGQNISSSKKDNIKCSLLTSQQYLQQKKIKQQVLDQIINRKSLTSRNNLISKTQPNQYVNSSILPSNSFFGTNSLVNSQQTLLSSIQGGNVKQSLSGSHVQNKMMQSNTTLINCSNHPHKKAKYKLLDSQQEMPYCSKCAINLLQQGFQVEQLKKNLAIKVISNPNIQNINQMARAKQLQQFQQKIIQVQDSLIKKISQIQKNTDLANIQEQIQVTNQLYETIFTHLQQIHKQQINVLNQIHDKIQYNNRQEINQLSMRITSLKQLKKQLKQYKIKFIEMKQNQYYFLLQSFVNKVNSYQQSIQIKKNNQQLKIQKNKLNKLQKIITKIYNTFTNKQGAQISFDRKIQQQISQDFYCQQVKQPFRNLFPQQQEQFDNKYINKKCQRKQAGDSPTFYHSKK